MKLSAGKKYIIALIPVIIVAIVSLLLIVISLSDIWTVNSVKEPSETPQPEKVTLSGSHTSGYYSEAFNFELKCNKENLRILYTMSSPEKRAPLAKEKTTPTGETYLFSGGKKPAPENMDETGIRKTYEYSGPVNIPKEVILKTDQFRVTVVVAAAFDGDERVSDYHYYTFIINSNGKAPTYKEGFGSYFVSICIDEDNLYDYETGILIKGKAFADEKRRNPGREVDGWFQRNYNQRGELWEREARIQIFNKEGNLVVDQDIGIRIAGGMSRHNDIKSMRIIAREKYDTENTKIKYMFFDGLKDFYGNEIKEFDKLVLRNSANDFGGLMFKDVFAHKLAKYVGIDSQEGTPCVVYINGKYYSLMNIRESLDNDYIEAHYKIPKESISMVSIASGTGYSFNYKLTSGPENGLKEFMKDMKKIINTNYSNKDISEIEQIIDTDNFIKYMAYQMYIANADWPHNNVLAWKYYGSVNSSVYGMDGKWRFLLKDLDLSTTFTSAGHNSYEAVLGSGMSDGEPSVGQVFKSCIRNPEFAKRFSDYMKKMCTEYITEERINNLIDSLKQERIIDIKNFWKVFGGNLRSWENIMKQFKQFGQVRGNFMLKQLDRYI